MEGGAFLSDDLQEEFGKWVEIVLHTDGKGEKYREASDRNRSIQSKRFGTVALPYYAFLDPSGETVYWKAGGVIDEDVFLERMRKARAQHGTQYGAR